MTEVEKEVDKMDELLKKINRCNNNIKLVHELLKTMDEKLNSEKKESKEGTENKRGIGRPIGTYEEKRTQYIEMLNTKKIKQPKSQTLQYYKIDYDEDTEKYS